MSTGELQKINILLFKLSWLDVIVVFVLVLLLFFLGGGMGGAEPVHFHSKSFEHLSVC